MTLWFLSDEILPENHLIYSYWRAMVKFYKGNCRTFKRNSNMWITPYTNISDLRMNWTELTISDMRAKSHDHQWLFPLDTTFIQNWPLPPFIQDCDLAYHTTYIVCVNFIHEWRNLQFKVYFERQIFEKLLMAIFCQKSAERKSPQKYLYIFVLMSNLGFELEPYV